MEKEVNTIPVEYRLKSPLSFQGEGYKVALEQGLNNVDVEIVRFLLSNSDYFKHQVNLKNINILGEIPEPVLVEDDQKDENGKTIPSLILTPGNLEDPKGFTTGKKLKKSTVDFGEESE